MYFYRLSDLVFSVIAYNADAYAGLGGCNHTDCVINPCEIGAQLAFCQNNVAKIRHLNKNVSCTPPQIVH